MREKLIAGSLRSNFIDSINDQVTSFLNATKLWNVEQYESFLEIIRVYQPNLFANIQLALRRHIKSTEADVIIDPLTKGKLVRKEAQ